MPGTVLVSGDKAAGGWGGDRMDWVGGRESRESMEASDKFGDRDGGSGSWADAESRDSMMVPAFLALAVEAVVGPTDRHSGSWER